MCLFSAKSWWPQVRFTRKVVSPIPNGSRSQAPAREMRARRLRIRSRLDSPQNQKFLGGCFRGTPDLSGQIPDDIGSQTEPGNRICPERQGLRSSSGNPLAN